MRKLLASTLLAAASSSQAAPTLKAEVNGMVCAFCAQGIEKHLRQLPQTKDVYVNLKDRVVAVEIKDGQSLAPDTVKAVVKDAGYDVVGIETVSQTAGELKAAAAK
ncbi:heavy-metal-associated domain-containing protein [Massilia genomosp. 1]|uniref:Heavy-metal-associated domain-containing protein n=1 Tax=Massilia genomosp. 1 TaxID=2609280 RepID=A0ABX0MND3_9BURK|nr:heavy metal-associated domain-containing protein [Massilia genomosp. 1]NHZ61518.1 heavy-metal-associated domain-containing protein [Massilia genomosp. 1]